MHTLDTLKTVLNKFEEKWAEHNETAPANLQVNKVTIIRPALIVHIDNRLKIGHCFMMSCMPNILPTKF